MAWSHNSGFNVHTKGRINGSDGNAIENIARACPVLDTGYMSRAALSVERVEFNPHDETITVYERQDRSPAQSFDKLRTGSASYTMGVPGSRFTVQRLNLLNLEPLNP